MGQGLVKQTLVVLALYFLGVPFPSLLGRIRSVKRPSFPQELDLTLSVAMCTYNGSAYLADQLASVSGQDLPPDEVVICDDRSTDNTLGILQAWANVAPFAVRIVVNPVNLGPSKNFERAIDLTTGGIIALADQDDVWHPAKLRLTIDALNADPSLGMLFTDAEVVDDALRPLGYRMWNTRRFRRAEQKLVARGRSADVLIRRNVVTGATMAFRASYRDLILPIPQNRIHVHDGWISFLIASVGGIGFLPEPLVDYRQRHGQVIGAHPPTGIKMLRSAARLNSVATSVDAHHATIEWFRQIRERLSACSQEYPPHPRVFKLIDGKIRHLEARIAMPRSRLARAGFVGRELATLGYHRYSIGMWAAAKDLTA